MAYARKTVSDSLEGSTFGEVQREIHGVEQSDSRSCQREINGQSNHGDKHDDRLPREWPTNVTEVDPYIDMDDSTAERTNVAVLRRGFIRDIKRVERGNASLLCLLIPNTTVYFNSRGEARK